MSAYSGFAPRRRRRRLLQRLDKRMRVLHIITGLGIGGAETMLYKLLAAMPRERTESHVIALRDGPMASRIAALGVPVEVIDFTGPVALLHLTRRIRAIKPDLAQTWMYHGDLIGGLAAKLAYPLAPRLPVIWNVRLAEVDAQYIKGATRAVIRACALMSHLIPEMIIVNADAARLSHGALGYAVEKFTLIPNGFDTGKFRPDPIARADMRHALGISEDAFVIGVAGRFDPQKNYRGFFDAARIVCAANKNIIVLACGEGVELNNSQMQQMMHGFSPGQVHLLGLLKNMPVFWASIDLAVSSSLGEGFSNAIGEAMSTAVLCVATNVGDSSRIIGDAGIIVAPKDSKALAQAMLAVAGMPKPILQANGERARQRIIDDYSINTVTDAFFHLWQDVLLRRKGL